MVVLITPAITAEEVAVVGMVAVAIRGQAVEPVAPGILVVLPTAPCRVVSVKDRVMPL